MEKNKLCRDLDFFFPNFTFITNANELNLIPEYFHGMVNSS
jgi:hypothetical protein